MKSIHLSIHDKQQLYCSYMPFIVGGGLFVATDDVITIGETVSVDLELLDVKYSFNGRVIWVTPQDAVGRARPQGVGVQIPEQHTLICSEIETLLVALATEGLERFTF